MLLTVDVVIFVVSYINLINKNLMYDMISVTQEPCQQRLQALTLACNALRSVS